MPGISAFVKGQDGSTFHTYSCFARGLDPMNPAYDYLDLTAFGRQEDGLPNPMSWVRLHDEYAARGRAQAASGRPDARGARRTASETQGGVHGTPD